MDEETIRKLQKELEEAPICPLPDDDEDL